jgi:hypothetical protein
MDDHNLTTLAARLRPLIIGAVEDTSSVSSAIKRQFMYHLPDAFTADTGGLRLYNRFGVTLTITEVHCSVGTAAAGTIAVDVNKNGSSILSSAVQIGPGDYTHSTTSINSPSFTDGQYLTVDVDSGSGVDLSVVILASG